MDYKVFYVTTFMERFLIFGVLLKFGPIYLPSREPGWWLICPAEFSVVGVRSMCNLFGGIRFHKNEPVGDLPGG